MTPSRLRGLGLVGRGIAGRGVGDSRPPDAARREFRLPVRGGGRGIRFWAAGHHGHPPEFVTAGPYRHTRNPLFLGRLLVLTGLCVMAPLPNGASWILLAAGWALLAGYGIRRKDRVESGRLLARYGDAYPRYRREVPALFPRLTPYDPGGTAPGWSSDRLVRNREPWMLAAIVAVTLFFVKSNLTPFP